MTDQKPTGVFVRLPLSDEQLGKLLAPIGPLNERLLSIGTPVTDGELEVAAYDNIASGYLSRVEPVTPSISLVRLSEAQAQIAARDAEIARLREALIKSVDALMRVTEERSTSYQAKNGRWVSIQGDDGERCDIIHSDITTDCEAALFDGQKALKGGEA